MLTEDRGASTSASVKGEPQKRRLRAKLARGALFVLAFVTIVLGLAAITAARHRARDRGELSANPGGSYFDSRGRRIRYYLAGEEQPGPTVVMLSGFTGALEQWHEAQDLIARFAPVLTYDRGGYGLSDPPAGYDADAQADELADLSQMSRIKRPLVVVGFSSSALIARAFARRHPDLLGALVFLDPTNPEQVADLSGRALYDRRVLYERVPLSMMLKRFFYALPDPTTSPSGPASPADVRACKILNFPSHWWVAYLEGSVMGDSAHQAMLDWSKLKVPIILLAVARPDGPPEVRERYRLYQKLVADSGAELMNPLGFNHNQVHGDPAFLPYIVNAVETAVKQSRSPAERAR